MKFYAVIINQAFRQKLNLTMSIRSEGIKNLFSSISKDTYTTPLVTAHHYSTALHTISQGIWQERLIHTSLTNIDLSTLIPIIVSSILTFHILKAHTFVTTTWHFHTWPLFWLFLRRRLQTTVWEPIAMECKHMLSQPVWTLQWLAEIQSRTLCYWHWYTPQIESDSSCL